MVSGDFLFGVPVWFERIFFVLYMGLILSYVIKEVRTQAWNLPKNLIMLSTGLTWYVGIVALNGDITFTFTNVIAHGIPYMALVWAHEQKEFSRLKTWWGPVSFLLIIVALAYGEEVLWAGLVWREHFAVFEFARLLPAVKEIEFLTLLVPLLTVPQATHYILDGFIWKRQGRRL
jgi:membrane protease YdiL (CAAX protease family)